MKFEIVEGSNYVIIETEDDKGLKKIKSISMKDFLASLEGAAEKKTFQEIESPIFRECRGSKLIQYKKVGRNKEIYVLLRKKGQVAQQIFERLYPNVGIPNLLVGVSVVNDRVSRLYVVAVKDDEIKSDTEIYVYPFTNVNETSGDVCMGGNKFTPGVSLGNKLYEVPNQFLAMPNTLHSFNPRNNTRGLMFEEMLQMLKDKDFDESLLIKNKKFKTYSEWFDNLM